MKQLPKFLLKKILIPLGIGFLSLIFIGFVSFHFLIDDNLDRIKVKIFEHVQKKIGHEFTVDTLAADWKITNPSLTLYDVSIFNQDNYLHDKKNSQKKSFMYVGNFRKVKGTDILLEAFNLYTEKYKGCWGLVCIGNGKLGSELIKNKKINVIPFSTSSEIIELTKFSDVFILPSRNDQWGVVVHEFTSMGMPLLLSENVGAKSEFFISGFNGFQFDENSPTRLAEMMKKFEEMDNLKLIEMGENSKMLSKRINVKTSAANFISLIN